VSAWEHRGIDGMNFIPHVKGVEEAFCLQYRLFGIGLVEGLVENLSFFKAITSAGPSQKV